MLLYLVVEIVALVALGSAIGVGATLLVLLAGSLLGLWLARREGVRAAQAIAEAATSRRVAHRGAHRRPAVAAAGVLLFVPGLVTDVAGLLLLLPPTRALVRRRLVRAAEERAPSCAPRGSGPQGPVVDGVVVEDPPPRAAEPLVIEGTVSRRPAGDAG